jgi:NAD+ synthase (glutamine-hydrolysing)
MKDGFVRVAVATPQVKVADCVFNAEQTIKLMREAEASNVALVAFPELGLTAYTCADLFLQNTLLNGALEALEAVVAASLNLEVVSVVGMPVIWHGKLYNCAVVVHRGKVLGVVPKIYIPNYNEFYECRWFTRAPMENALIDIIGFTVPFGTDILFKSETMDHFIFAVELCEDLWVASPPSVGHACEGATVLVNLSASDELVGKAYYKRQLVASHSARLLCAYLYAGSGPGESTTDMVFAGHDLIAENGIILNESETPFEGLLFSEVDVERLAGERRRSNTFEMTDNRLHDVVRFSDVPRHTPLSRTFGRYPFVPEEGPDRDARCRTIRMIQAMGLVKRLEHTGTKRVVVGISGGLDSTLALLVAVDAFDRLGISREGIVAITMPCFGTTDRTRNNAKALASVLNVTLREIDISEAVLCHFRDIGHDRDTHDVTFENAQARERTQVLMDMANKEAALVVGTGDLSELALGWATYNGDHMSMYSVNASVPKTLIRHLVDFHAQTEGPGQLAEVLNDVLDTPVSPELLPAKDGTISQVTEDIVGPYELHDFFLYYAIRWAFGPSKVFRIALTAFDRSYDRDTILKWLKIFYRRFFSQQFKRSALPDGPKVGSVALSPRGDLRMPSDACVRLWLEELEEL